ncbi:MAG: hypothetical protein WBB00_07870 [Mycobacterium sp.]
MFFYSENDKRNPVPLLLDEYSLRHDAKNIVFFHPRRVPPPPPG